MFKLVEALFTTCFTVRPSAYRHINLSEIFLTGTQRDCRGFYGGHCLMRVCCTCEYMDALQKLRKKYEPTPKCSNRRLSHGCDLQQVRRVFVCVITHHFPTLYTVLRVTLKVSFKVRISSKRSIKTVLPCRLSAFLDSLSVLDLLKQHGSIIVPT